MATQPQNHYDWPAGTANGLNVGPDMVTYPFLNYPTKDTTTKVYTVSHVVQKVANYIPQPALSTYSGNPNAYLVEETDIQIDQLQQARNQLKYSMVPTNQVQGVSRSITRPPPRNTRPNGIDVSSLLANVSNGSSSGDGAVIGNCLVSSALNILCAPIYPITSYVNAIAMVSNTSPFNSSNSIAIYFDYGIVKVNSNVTYLAEQSISFVESGKYNIINSTAINFATYFSNIMTAKYVAPYLKGYSPGTPTIRTNQIESFYLPTITPNINTFHDIPLPQIIANDIDYFKALADNAPNLGSNTITYDFDGPVVWMGPIYKLTQWNVKTSDL